MCARVSLCVCVCVCVCMYVCMPVLLCLLSEYLFPCLGITHYDVSVCLATDYPYPPTNGDQVCWNSLEHAYTCYIVKYRSGRNFCEHGILNKCVFLIIQFE